MMAAMLECSKLLLSGIPNIETVSLLIAVFSYVFGPCGLLASIVFVCIEPLVWGVGSWVVSYFIYWPTLSLVFWLLGKGRLGKRFLPTAVAVGMTVLFGILTSLVDIGLFSGSYENFFYRFGIYYARGIGFYVTHVLSNAVIFFLLFLPLTDLCERIGGRIPIR